MLFPDLPEPPRWYYALLLTLVFLFLIWFGYFA
jgi:hypothetical protein